MRRRIAALGAALLMLAVAGAAVAATRGGATGNAVVKTFAGEKIVPNRYFQDEMRFSPGTISVKSGAMLTFTYGDKEMEPHTLTIVKRSDLPKTAAQAENCRACERYATPHLKNPKAPPDEHNPIVHWTLNKGQPGLDTVGDSVAIMTGAHKQISVEVSAPAGTTLYFLCALHPWMQGKIVVS